MFRTFFYSFEAHFETINRMNRNIKILLPLLLASSVALGVWLGIKINRRVQPSTSQPASYFQPDKLSLLLKLIERDYVDSIDHAEIVENVIPDLLHELDPHSTYIPAKDMKTVNEEMRGNFSGIGVQFVMQNDTVMIVEVISGGPSQSLGIMAGDRIVEVDGKNIAGQEIGSDSIVTMLRGKKNTMVNVKIFRPGFPEFLNFDIKRGEIPIYSIDASYMIKPDVGFIKINRFAESTYSEFVTALNNIIESGAEKLIIDLRGNAGGSLQGVIQMVDEFLPENRLIVYTEGKSRSRFDYNSSANGRWKENDVAVLIDEFSASASEIFAGALQDNDRGLIIGRRSFGKGLVQEQIPFFDGSALRLTVARFYTPSGRSIQKPYDNGFDEYIKDYYNRVMHDELSQSDSIQFNEELKYHTLNGRIVFGGGGIMPDIFVPIDTTEITPFLSAIASKNLLYHFAFDYSDKNRNELNQNANNAEELEAYLNKINIIAQFLEYIKEKEVKYNHNEFKQSEQLLNTQLCAYISRNIIGNSGFYQVILKDDNTVKKAIELLNEDWDAMLTAELEKISN
jgi:carboxyl-terminal processing protease